MADNAALFENRHGVRHRFDFGQQVRTVQHRATFSLQMFNQVAIEFATRDGIELLYENERLAGLMTEDPGTMDCMVDVVRELAADVPEFSFNRNHVWMRFAHFGIHKGSSLAELSRLLGIPREDVLAIGDHHNDIPMLDGSSAAMVACPSNAMPEVQELVRRNAGYVSPHPWGEGVADAIRHFSAVS